MMGVWRAIKVCLVTLSFMQHAQCQVTFEGQIDRLLELRDQAVHQRDAFEALAEKLGALDMTRREFLKIAKSRIETELEQFGKRSESDTVDIDGKKITIDGDTAQCFKDSFATLVYAEKKAGLWAMKMIDSIGRPGPGFLMGRSKWPGYFDECVAVNASYYDTGKTNTFDGRYCNANINLTVLGIQQIPIDIWGLCLPSSCNNKDAFLLVSYLLHTFNVSDYVKVRGMQCHQPLELPVRTIVVLSLVGFFVLVVVVATVVDIILIQVPQWKRQPESEVAYIQEDRDDDDLLDQNTDELGTLFGPLSNINEYSPGLQVKLLLTFSAWTNSHKIWNTSQSKSSISCVNGIRVISMSWVILGHCVFFPLGILDNTFDSYNTYVNRWTFQAIYNATFSVDSFFVLSGLLVSYLTLSEMRRESGKINWFMFYLHRYLRLTPLYMLVLAVWVTTQPYWADGPFFSQSGIQTNFCEDTWWKNMLYIQNFFHNDNMCLGWSWYLADDMLFYVLSPIILVPLYIKPLIGYLVIALFFIATTVTPFILTMLNYYGPGVGQVDGHPEDQQSRTFNIYFAPYCRMGPYLQGMILGYIFYRTNRRVHLHWAANLVGWCAASTLALAVLYGLFDNAKGDKIDVVTSAFYNSLSRCAWGLSVCWVIFSCVVTRWAAPVNAFLSLPVWVPLGRLTYAVYLIHPIVIIAWVVTKRTTFYLDDISLIMLYLACLVACYAIGFVVSIVFESPFMALESVLLKKKKRQ